MRCQGRTDWFIFPRLSMVRQPLAAGLRWFLSRIPTRVSQPGTGPRKQRLFLEYMGLGVMSGTMGSLVIVR